MTERVRPSRLVYVLAVLCLGAIVAAALLVGPPSSQSASQRTRLVRVERGVVQSTVSGSGNLQAASQLNLGFKTGGVVQAIYTSEGAHVSSGQLLAELEPQSAEVALEQSKANLQGAEAKLAQEEAAQAEASTQAEAAARATRSSAPGSAAARSAYSQPQTSAATLEAEIASAKAAVRSEELAVHSAEQALAATKLYAPESGTIAELSGQVGEAVSGGGTTKSGESSSASGAAAESNASARNAAAGGSSSGSGGNSGDSSEPFAVLSDLSSMDLVVGMSESEVGEVRPGQPATVTIEALEGRKLAAHVVRVATLPTSTSGVVSYDVTFRLDQMTSGLKPGMSASVEVVVEQAEGVNVPTDAISGGAVTVVQGAKRVRRSVVSGLAGDSSTIILSGLRAGEQIALPLASASTTTSSLLSRLGARSGGTLGGGGVFLATPAGGGFKGRG
jgi:multidrug efflux pump subunit AcrA (membrane-fusion protein)